MNVKFQQSQQFIDEQNKYSNTSTAMAGSKISKLQDTGTLYLNKIKQESERLRLLEEEIQKNEEILKNKRKSIIKSFGDTDRSQQKDQDPEYIKKKIKQIHVKLNKNRQKHNETLAHNTQLRSEINALRREKNIFSQIQQNLLLELQQKSLDQSSMREKCVKSQEDFKAIKQMLENTKHRTFKEQKEFEKEFQTVFRFLDVENRDGKLKEIKQEANRKKGNNDSLLFASKYMGDTYGNQQEIGMNQSGMLGSQVGFRGSKAQEQRRTPTGKMQGGVSAKDMSCLDGIRSEVQQYQHTFAQLQQETGKDTIQEIVEKFVEQEEHNFSLFTFINTQSDELESLERHKNTLKQEIQRIKYPHIDNNDSKLKKIKGMQVEIIKFKDKYDKMKKTQLHLQKTLNSLKIGIPNIFEKIGCNNKAYLEEWGELLNINDINEGNILSFLGIIEKRTNEILQMYNQVYKKNKEKKSVFQDPNESGSSLSVDQLVTRQEGNPPVHREQGQLKDMIEGLEEERKTAKASNNDQKATKLFDKNDFKKYAETEMDTMINAKKPQKVATGKR